MRISIIGGPASGKSWLAQKISKKFNIPHIQIDRFWFEAGGLHENESLPEAERNRIREYIKTRTFEFIEKDSWVSDGFYSRSVGPEIAKRADVIIFLNIPLWRRLINHAKRVLKPSTRHLELGLWHELTFFPEIVRRTYANGPKMRSFVKEYENKVITLTSRKEINEYLQKLTT